MSQVTLRIVLLRGLLVGALIGCVSVPVRAQQSTGLSFLRIGTNAAGNAMGDAQVALSRDAFSTYWNPAGLVDAENSIAVSHHIWISDVRTYTLAGRMRSGDLGGIGFFVTALDGGDFEAREQPGDPNGVFDAQFVSTGVSYGRAFGLVHVGATAKYLSERIFANTASGYAFDLGAQVRLLQEGIYLGAALHNVGRMSELNVEASRLPRTVRAGVAVYPFRVLATDDNAVLLSILMTAEVSHVFPAETTQWHFGGAAEVMDLVIVRAGYITDDVLRGFSAGGGLEGGGFLFDYAFLPFESGFEGPGHVLTLHYTW